MQITMYRDYTYHISKKKTPKPKTCMTSHENLTKYGVSDTRLIIVITKYVM